MVLLQMMSLVYVGLTTAFWGMVEIGQQNASFTYLLIQGLFCGRRDVVESGGLMLWEENGFNSEMFWGIQLHVFNALPLVEAAICSALGGWRLLL